MDTTASGTPILVDARGLSCPEPVIMTMGALKKTTASGVVVRVMVDTATSRDNVMRAGRQVGWRADVENTPDGAYCVSLVREP